MGKINMGDEDIFDPSLKKKKKKKKVPFDVGAALADAEGPTTETPNDDTGKLKDDKEDKDLDDLDLDFTTAKKKKTKKAFNMDELDDALPEKEKTVKTVKEDDDIDLDMDFSTTKKKKKKKNLKLDDLIDQDVEEGDKENFDENVPVWLSSDRDYTYDELLNRVFDIMKEKNPDIVAGSKRKFVMRPPQVLRVGT